MENRKNASQPLVPKPVQMLSMAHAIALDQLQRVPQVSHVMYIWIFRATTKQDLLAVIGWVVLTTSQYAPTEQLHVVG